MEKFNFDLNFDYLLIIGNSGMGKTQLAKNIAMQLKQKGFKIIVADPNREWSDLQDQEIGAPELADAITKIAKPLLFEKREGLLVIEDIGFSLAQIQSVLNIPLTKAKNYISLILENARKYRLKIIITAHRLNPNEIDSIMFQQFDKVICFKFPLTPYSKKLLASINIDHTKIPNLQKLQYLSDNAIHEVPIVQSHINIENAQDFTVRQILSQCKNNREKVAVLKITLGMSHNQIAGILGITYDMVKTYCYRIRKMDESLRQKLPPENKASVARIQRLLT
jgi:DNA-directed RNA polymerase specialized sigma24 family protein